ncbi:MAG: type 4a pilus biogenesis protein PilO [Candidatus Omnitrophica bacterium]|nr:type 4a pilus biogenesis protein PilO [Candidatus Omnitrophota bacterium]
MRTILNNIIAIFTNLKKSPKQMIIVISAGCAFALLLYFNFLLKPQVINISGIRSNLGKVSADLRAAKSDIAKINSMRSAVEAYNKKLDKYEKTLPTEEGIPDLLESLSEMAKSSNMRIAGIVPVDQQKGAGSGNRVYKEIPIMITAKAGYHGVGRFLSSLENSDRFMKVVDMQIKADPASPKKHDVELLVVTYVLLGGR